MKKSTKQVIGAIGVGAAIGGGLMAEAILTAPKSHADVPVSGCQDDLWIMLDSKRRVICDGPIQPDGQYLRVRIRYTAAHEVPGRTNCYGYSYVSCTTYSGYFVPYNEAERTSYYVSVNPEAENHKLDNEPEHLVNGNRF